MKKRSVIAMSEEGCMITPMEARELINKNLARKMDGYVTDFMEILNRYQYTEPIAFLGSHSVAKHEVAINLCRKFTESFDIENGVCIDKIPSNFKDNNKTCYYFKDITHYTSKLAYSKSDFINILSFLQNSRAFNNKIIFTAPRLRDVRMDILRLIRVFGIVKKTTKDYHVVEFYIFEPPFSAHNVFAYDNIVNEEISRKYVMNVLSSFHCYVTKIPRLDKESQEKYEKKVDEYYGKQLSELKEKIKGRDSDE